MNKLKAKGQTLLELVAGMGILVAIITALAITTTYSLRNTQFSKNQALATRLAQENLEKVRTIKTSNLGVCPADMINQTPSCKTWEEIWAVTFGTAQPCTAAAGCTYEIINGCTVTNNVPVTSLCLSYSPAPMDLGNPEDDFTGQILIEDETGSPTTQKRVTSRVFWTDSTGVHSSDLVTIFSKY